MQIEEVSSYHVEKFQPAKAGSAFFRTLFRDSHSPHIMIYNANLSTGLQIAIALNWQSGQKSSLFAILTTIHATKLQSLAEKTLEALFDRSPILFGQNPIESPVPNYPLKRNKVEQGCRAKFPNTFSAWLWSENAPHAPSPFLLLKNYPGI